MKAVKGNKAYTVDEKQAKRYAEEGFDIQDDNGKVVIAGKGKTVSYEDYVKVVKERDELLEAASDKATKGAKEPKAKEPKAKEPKAGE